MKRLFKYVEDIILGVMFFGLVAPIAIFLRLMGRDILSRKLNGTKKSYWVERSQERPNTREFYNQFITK